jgi:hypothetical protein
MEVMRSSEVISNIYDSENDKFDVIQWYDLIT